MTKSGIEKGRFEREVMRMNRLNLPAILAVISFRLCANRISGMVQKDAHLGNTFSSFLRWGGVDDLQH
jgi:hypothetical protein